MGSASRVPTGPENCRKGTSRAGRQANHVFYWPAHPLQCQTEWSRGSGVASLGPQPQALPSGSRINTKPRLDTGPAAHTGARRAATASAGAADRKAPLPRLQQECQSGPWVHRASPRRRGGAERAETTGHRLLLPLPGFFGVPKPSRQPLQ